MLTIREFGLIFGRLCFVLGNQVASKYTNLLAFRLRIVKWEVEETFDNLDIAYLMSKLKRMRRRAATSSLPLFSYVSKVIL